METSNVGTQQIRYVANIGTRLIKSVNIQVGGITIACSCEKCIIGYRSDCIYNSSNSSKKDLSNSED